MPVLPQEGQSWSRYGTSDRVVNLIHNTMPDIHNRKELEQFRKNLRNNSTSAEATLWNYLKGKQLGKKFRRQHSVGKYILDFYCATDRIAIELDGNKHFSEEGMKYDADRTKYLNGLNIKVIRFENVRVFQDVQAVLKEIKAVFDHPDPADFVGGSVPPDAGGK